MLFGELGVEGSPVVLKRLSGAPRPMIPLRHTEHLMISVRFRGMACAALVVGSILASQSAWAQTPTPGNLIVSVNEFKFSVVTRRFSMISSMFSLLSPIVSFNWATADFAL